MILSDVFERFVKESPVCVMVRATLENVLSPQRVDDLFARSAVRQRPSELLFSSVADLMGLVVCRIRPSVHAAYRARAESFQVSLAALYDKLRGIETQVSRALVQETAKRMEAIVRQTGGMFPEALPGYRVLIADGNHLPATERRLKELRTRNVAPLPGHAVVVFDPALKLAVDVLPCGWPRLGTDVAAGSVGDSGSQRSADRRPQFLHHPILDRRRSAWPVLLDSPTRQFAEI